MPSHARTTPPAHVRPPPPARASQYAPLLWPARLIPLIPLAVMIRPLGYHAPQLQVYGGQVLGLGATLCLLGCLAVTPLTRVLKWKRAAWWRKWLGLCVLFLGGAGLVIAAAGGPRGQAGMRVSGNAQEWTGTVIVLALIPLALTSNSWTQKLLGSHWKTWQRRLTWTAWAVLAMHIVTLAAWPAEIGFFLASGPLLAARIPAARKDLSGWKAGGHQDGARWILTGISAGIFTCGMTILLGLEVVASAAAVRLT